MKRCDGVHRCAAAMLIAVFALARVCTAQDETQTPREAVEERPPGKAPTFTIYPVPRYGGDFGSRSYLTGDWGGLRSKLADRGVQFDFNITQIFQGVASGGTNRTGRYSGLTDMVLKLDFQKLGLWPRGFLFVEAQVPFGNTVNSFSGGILPVNTLVAMTAPAINEIILPHLYFTQFFTDWFAVVIGKLDTTGGDANEFAHGRGDDKFMNLAFSFNPVVITLAPYAPLGMSLLFLPHKDVVYAFGVVDTQGLPNTAGFKTLVEDPTTLTNEVRVTVRPFGLTGHQLLGVAWANKPFTLLPQDRRTILRNILLGTPLKTTSNNWGLYYNFDQYLYQDEHNPTRGFGIFFRAGVANPNTSAFQQFYSFGFGGKGIIPGREKDQFGIGYYYLKFSGDVPSGLRRAVSLDHEQGAELFYNFEFFPWLHVTPDLQIISPSRKTLGTPLNPGKNISTGVVPSLRVKVDF
ncbi:MAG TPA: carbohydrate porin [Candidatus Acidoferrum sp.]|nr:carbohydrate porin [Candidatus Acidoferrum sp.]